MLSFLILILPQYNEKRRLEFLGAHRSIPADKLDSVRNIENEAYIAWRIGKYKIACSLYEKLLKLIFDIQQDEDRPIHKGTPLHMIGLMSFFQGAVDTTLYNFTLAYIEDTLNVAYGLESTADETLAGRVLIQFFKIDSILKIP